MSRSTSNQNNASLPERAKEHLPASINALPFQNYQSSTDGAAELALDQKFIALFGLNNSGESALLRALYESRRSSRRHPRAIETYRLRVMRR